MKKLTLGLAALFTSVITPTFGYQYQGCGPFTLSAPNLCGGFNMGLTGLWLRTSTPHLDYAQRYPAFIQPDIEDPFGPLDPIFENGKYRSVDPRLAGGYRINVGYVFPCTSNDAVFAFAHVDRDDNDFIERGQGVILPAFTSFPETLGGTILIPAEPGVIDFIFSGPPFIDASLYDIFLAYDGVGIGGVPIEKARARADFKYKAWDLEFGQYASLGCNTRIRVFAGIRGAKLEHSFDIFYSGTTAVTVTDFLGLSVLDNEFAVLTLNGLIVNHQKSAFAGTGPRIGVNASYTLTGGISLTAEASTAVLVGDSHSDFRKDYNTNAILTEVLFTGIDLTAESASTSFSRTENFKHSHQTRVSPNLEAKIALSYTYQFPKPYKTQLTIEGGYMSTAYYNTLDRITNVADVGAQFRTRNTLDTSLDGPYLGVQFVL